MRRFSLLLFLMCLASAAMAQSRYVVYKCSGDVSVNRFRTQEWVPVQRQDDLSLLDMVRIADQASMVVLDTRNRGLYRFEEEGSKSLKAWIEEAARKSDNVTANLNKELMSQLGDKGSEKSYTQVAAAYRGKEASPSYMDSLSSYIKEEVASLLRMNGLEYSVCYGDFGKASAFKGFREDLSSEEICFGFVNGTSEGLFVNAVYVDEDGRCSLCYEFDYSSESSYVFVPAGEEVKVGQYLFAPFSDGGKILFIATSRPYDSHALQQLLN